MSNKGNLFKLLSLGFVLVFLLAACSTVTSDNDTATDTEPTSNQSTNAMTDKKEDNPNVDTEPKENQIVLFETTLGNVKLEIYNSTMPITGNNFTNLVEKGYYDGVIFHRVIPNFMAQGGDPTGTGAGGPGYNIPDEFEGEQKNDRATISMANAGPNTGGSQFFINVVDNNFLDGKHPVFGKVIEGMDIVDKMVSVETEPGDRPVEEIVINKATIINN